ncbi:MAG: hypothetical protein K2I72_02110 [Bacilli bacterium]|nr:hypothetical protein [Bacilli bacterium]
MRNKIDLKYYKDGLVQVMCPITENCTCVGKGGIQFHSNDGTIFQNDYLSHPKRNLFPFSEQPVHEDENGCFTNQLFELNQSYLFIYSDFELPRFVERYLSSQNGEVYLQTEELSIGSKTKEELDKESFQEKLKYIVTESNFAFFLDSDGCLEPINEKELEADIPLSGIFVYGKDSKIEASVYQMTLEEDQMIVEMGKVERYEFQNDSLQAETFTIEPDMKKSSK